MVLVKIAQTDLFSAWRPLQWTDRKTVLPPKVKSKLQNLLDIMLPKMFLGVAIFFLPALD